MTSSEQYPESQGTSNYAFRQFAGTQNTESSVRGPESNCGAEHISKISGQASKNCVVSPGTNLRTFRFFKPHNISIPDRESTKASSGTESPKSSDGEDSLSKTLSALRVTKSHDVKKIKSMGIQVSLPNSSGTDSDDSVTEKVAHQSPISTRRRSRVSFGIQVSLQNSSGTDSDDSVTKNVANKGQTDTPQILKERRSRNSFGLQVSLPSSSGTVSNDSVTEKVRHVSSTTTDESPSVSRVPKSGNNSLPRQLTQNTLDDLIGPSCRKNIFGNLLYLSDEESSPKRDEKSENSGLSSSTGSNGAQNFEDSVPVARDQDYKTCFTVTDGWGCEYSLTSSMQKALTIGGYITEWLTCLTGLDSTKQLNLL